MASARAVEALACFTLRDALQVFRKKAITSPTASRVGWPGAFISSFAKTECGDWSDQLIILEPPPQYDHAYHGHVIEQRLSSEQVRRICGSPDACSWRDEKKVCHIVIRTGADSADVGLMRRHETGHCNGWPAFHPDGRWVNRSGKQVRIKRGWLAGWF